MARAGTDSPPPGVLVVEDNFLFAEVICEFLRSCGLRPVGPAADVESALRLAHAGGIDAAVLDINLQGRLCFPICSALARRHVPFMFLSGYSMGTIVPAEYRSALLIEKPFVPEEFEAGLYELISGRMNSHNGTEPLEPLQH